VNATETRSHRGERTLDAGGILPLAIGVPALLGLAAGGLALRRRRLVVAG